MRVALARSLQRAKPRTLDGTMISALKTLSAYEKNVLAWVVIMVLGLSAIFASLYVSNWFLLAFAAVAYGPQFVLKRIVCPKCGTPVTYQGQLFGFAIQGGFIRRKCQACEWDLREHADSAA